MKIQIASDLCLDVISGARRAIEWPGTGVAREYGFDQGAGGPMP